MHLCFFFNDVYFVEFAIESFTRVEKAFSLVGTRKISRRADLRVGQLTIFFWFNWMHKFCQGDLLTKVRILIQKVVNICDN